jgi:hypothetical protein
MEGPYLQTEFGLGQGLGQGLELIYGHKCMVCWDIIDGKSTIGKISGCNHAFHRNCIMQWYRAQINDSLRHNCPVCRCVESKLILIKVISMDREGRDDRECRDDNEGRDGSMSLPDLVIREWTEE